MKLTLHCALLLVCAAAAYPAAFTSSQTGNWNSSATWGGAGVPGNGDTVIVRHTVTVNVNTTVGTSPATIDTSSTPAIDVQDTSTAGQDGKLIVPNGVTLTVRGNVRFAGTAGTANVPELTVNPGGTFIFDNTQAPSSGVGEYRFYPGGSAQRTLITFGTDGVTSPRAVFRGKPNGASGVNAAMVRSHDSWAELKFYGTDIYDCGTGHGVLL